MTEERIKKIVAFFRIWNGIGGFGGLIWLGLYFLLVLATKDNHFASFVPFMGLIALMSLCIYYGLKNFRPWVVPTIIYLSSIKIILTFLRISQPTSWVGVLASALGSIIDLIALYFFSRKEVKDFFQAKSIFLFF